MLFLPKGEDYGIQVICDSSLIFSKNFSLSSQTGFDEEIIDVELKAITKGNSFVLENILFDSGDSELKSASFLELNQLVAALTKNNLLKIEIAGYTDNVGNDEVNLELSRRRAQAVYNYIINQGIKPDRLTFNGYGSANAIEKNDTKEGRKRNRRVEVIIR